MDDDKKEIVNTEYASSPEHQPGLLSVWLAEKGVEIVIAGGMGPRAVDLFKQRGIGVVLGTMENDPAQAVLSYVGGSLTTGDNVCNHDYNECTH